MTRRPRRKELGVTLDDYERLLEAQGGGCALCGQPPKTRRLDVDHDHRTGLLRGLLCQRCNRAVPSERYMPKGWNLRTWATAVSLYASGYPARKRPLSVPTMDSVLDAINTSRQDGEQ